MKRIRSLIVRSRPQDYLFALAAVAATAAVLLAVSASLSIEVIALLFLLPVMLAATRWPLSSPTTSSSSPPP